MADLTNAQYNDAGQIAIRRYTTIPKIISCGDREYVSEVHANICLAWVDPEDIDCVLAKVHKCCGGNKKREYSLADETHVRRWLNRGGR